MGCGASVAASLDLLAEDTCTSLGSTIGTPMWSEASTSVPMSDWTILECPMTPKQIRRLRILDLQLSRAQLDWYEKIS